MGISSHLPEHAAERLYLHIRLRDLTAVRGFFSHLPFFTPFR
jgi:hypothetical protein